MAFFQQETVTSMHTRSTGTAELSLWPDATRVAHARYAITQGASGQGEGYFPLYRQQLLEVLAAMNRVDSQVLQLINELGVCLGDIDISDYRNAIQRLDKPNRTEEENRAFLGYQQAIGSVLTHALAAARRHVEALDATQRSLELVPVDDNRALIVELESRQGNVPDALLAALLEELKNPQDVTVGRTRYVHEVNKLIVAIGYFFDNVLENHPDVIQRAEAFKRQADSLLADLRGLRVQWQAEPSV